MRTRWFTALLLFCAASLAVGAGHFRSEAQAHFRATQRYEDVYFLPPPDYLVVFSLGYRETVADLIWMKALVYFGDELVHRGGVANVYRYTDAMLGLDPDFKKVYHWVAGTAIYRPGHVGVEDVNKAIAYLKQGTRRFPDDGELAWDLGATYSFELPPLLKTRAQVAEARRQGLEYLALASLRGAGPAWLALQAATQFDQLGKTEQALRHLEDVYAMATDPDTKNQIERRMTRLRSAAYTEAFRRSNDDLTAARAKSFPYVSDTLFLLIGPRPAFDGDALLLRKFDPIAAPAKGAGDTEQPPD